MSYWWITVSIAAGVWLVWAIADLPERALALMLVIAIFCWIGGLFYGADEALKAMDRR
jgi:hypothetical protein